MANVMKMFVRPGLNGCRYIKRIRQKMVLLKLINHFKLLLGSQGEPTLVPEFCDFLETVYNTNVVPNYTTNGIILSYWNKTGSRFYLLANKILDYTNKYCGGVAVSFGNKSLRKFAKDAVNGLIEKG